jgi:hypothetical protein
MNMRRLLSLLVIAVLTLVPSFLLTGCEDEDSPDTGGIDSYFADHPYVSDPRTSTGPRIVSISPVAGTVSFVGQQVVFTASGGRLSYNWDVSVSSRGSLAVRPGTQSAVYTASVVSPNDVIVYDQDGHAALATINGPTTPLVATANPSTVSTDEALSILTASGGVPPYTWVASDTFHGTVSPSVGGSVVYTRHNAGDNSVTVTDSASGSYSVVIRQP